jgi:hypothetical protein
MSAESARQWALRNLQEDDRRRLFQAVAAEVDAGAVLYPGSYVDLGPSLVFGDVTYVDVDDRAAAFFADRAGVTEVLATTVDNPVDPTFDFLHADYTATLDLPAEAFDLLVSLYGGFISEHCTDHLRIGGSLLANPSHGDAAMASIDPRYELAGVITADIDVYRVDTDDLDTYLVPKKPTNVTPDFLHEWGRGVAYTRSPFAYLFTRVA